MARKKRAKLHLDRLPQTALVYYRVSDPRQMQTGNIEQQKPAVEALCASRGWKILKRFEEQHSAYADAAFRRDAFAEMMQYCRDNRGKIGHVVVWDVKRFARSVEAFLTFQAELNTMGIQVEILNLPPETTAIGRLVRVFMAAIAEHGSAVDAEASTRGMLVAQRERGTWTHQAPLGYCTNPVPRSAPCMFVDKTQGPIVRTMLEEFSTGRWTQTEVFARAARKGLRTMRGNGNPPAQSRARVMLTNIVYTARMRDVETGDILQGNWEPLISVDTFEKNQSLLGCDNGHDKAGSNGNGARAYRRLREDFALKSTVHCAGCGEFLTAYWNKKKGTAYYRCFKPDCHQIHVRKEILEGEFLNLLDRVQPTTEYLEKTREHVLEVFARSKRAKLASRKKAESEIKRVQDKRQILVDAFLFARTIDEPTYRAQLQRLDAQEQKLLGDIETAQRAASVDVERMLGMAMRNLTDFRRRWEHGSLEMKMSVQHVAFPDGLKFDGKHFLTPVTGIFCKDLQRTRKQKYGMAPRAGIEPASKP